MISLIASLLPTVVAAHGVVTPGVLPAVALARALLALVNIRAASIGYKALEPSLAGAGEGAHGVGAGGVLPAVALLADPLPLILALVIVRTKGALNVCNTLQSCIGYS